MAEASKVLSKASSSLNKGEYGYPTGHLGHLDESQESALVEFKELCARNGLYKPAKDGNPSSHDDSVMLRFLRARRFNPNDAYTQFRDTEKWREVNHIDKLYYNIDIDNYEEARRLYPQWTGRRDQRGIPVFVFQVKSLDNKAMAAYAKSTATTAVVDMPTSKAGNNAKTVDAEGVAPPRLVRLFALYEYLAGFMVELCSSLHDRQYPETPITQSNNIVDISGVGLKQFWNLRSHMQDASVLATAHYPETLDRIFIVGAPSFFPTVWSWIKRWFDPITVSKIFILGHNDVYRTLSKYIDQENIPKKYGGTLDYDFGQLPTIDPAYADRLEWKEPKAEGRVRRWPHGPLAWQHRKDGGMDLLAVGSVKGKTRREVIATLKPEDPAEKVNGQAPVTQTEPAKEEEVAEALKATTPPPATGPGEPETVVIPIEQKVEPIPQEAVATELPKDKAEAQVQSTPITNGKV